jgi:diguanylate cyclase (GGDEF)-like protein
MKILLPIIANSLVLVGLLVLIISLLSIRKLISQLSGSSIRKKWIFQGGLTFLFILGYLGYMIYFQDSFNESMALIVPGIFFFGAIFVLLTSSLSLQTAVDIKRVALLEHESITDPLIGIYNRRFMNRRLQEEFDRAQRYKNDLALLLIDIDHFKGINDTYGHEIGDMVLRYCGSLILEKVRGPDIVCRYGGEEILIIAPMIKSAGALSMAERIRTSISIHKFVLSSENNQQIQIQITVSIGVTCLNPQIKSINNFIVEADKAMYKAKENGRNRVILASTTVIDGDS